MKNFIKALTFTTCLSALALTSTMSSAEEQKPLTVVELFTSQGCSSCPPADEYLGELAARDDILALSFHVDYWDYIGWKDPFADARFSARQRSYAQHFGLRYVYTPQMVIDGNRQATGSQRNAVEQAIEQQQKHPKWPITASLNQGSVEVDFSNVAPDQRRPVSLFLAVFEAKRETPVRRGENGGRQLVNYNVVRHYVEVGYWDSQNDHVKIALPENLTTIKGGCAIVAQFPETKQIIAATKMSF